MLLELGVCVEREVSPVTRKTCPVSKVTFQNTPITSILYPAPPLVTQAKIIFIAACNMDANMQKWLGVTSSTVGRALVLPLSTTDIDLDMGEYEWERIAVHVNDVPGVTMYERRSRLQTLTLSMRRPGTTKCSKLFRRRPGR